MLNGKLPNEPEFIYDVMLQIYQWYRLPTNGEVAAMCNYVVAANIGDALTRADEEFESMSIIQKDRLREQMTFRQSGQKLRDCIMDWVLKRVAQGATPDPADYETQIERLKHDMRLFRTAASTRQYMESDIVNVLATELKGGDTA